MYKQVIVVRTDLKLSKGKIAAQASHAAVSAADRADRKILSKWKNEGQKKVVLKVPDMESLMKIKKSCEKLRIVNAVIIDAGRTELQPGTATCIGIGPDREEKIDKVTGSLPLLK
jgi:PTH2 family peptidyl-tRNA hydrolase